MLAASCSSKPSASGPEGGGTPEAGEDGGGCAQFTDDANLTSPTVSFKNDVLPIFQFGCGISSSCHGGMPATDISARGLFLGCSATDIDSGACGATDPNDEAAMVYMGLVGPNPNTPIEESCMPFVKPGMPEQSYLMHKLDNDQSCTVTCCTPNNTAVMQAEVTSTGVTPTGSGWCGVYMPYQIAVLPAGPICGEPMACTGLNQSRDTIRAWIAQGAMNN